MHRYEQLNCIGHGSYGTVYKCRLRGTGQYVALKVISLLGKSKEEQEQLQSEISLVQSLYHANVIKYYETFTDDQMLYIASELCNSDLFEILQDGMLSTQELKKVAKEVLQGLNYLHNKRIAHRDVKPNNVLLSTDGSLKLADFGFAKQFSESTINMRSIKGSPLYLAPEVARGLAYTTQADIWSFGIMMYELAVQRPPIIASDYIQLLKMLQKDDLEVEYDVEIFQEDPLLKDLIDQCLQLNPDKRANTAELLKHSYLLDGKEPEQQVNDDSKENQVKLKSEGWFLDLKASAFQKSYYEQSNKQDVIEQNNSSLVYHNGQNQEIENNEQQQQDEYMQSITDNQKQQMKVEQKKLQVQGSKSLDNNVTLFEVLNDLLCRKNDKFTQVIKIIKDDYQQKQIYDRIIDGSLDIQQIFITQLLHNYQDTNILTSFFEGLEQQVIKKLETYVQSSEQIEKSNIVRLIQNVLHYLKATNILFLNKATHKTPILFGNKPTYPFDLWVYGDDGAGKNNLGGILEKLNIQEFQFIYTSIFSMCINSLKVINQHISKFDNGERLCSLSCVLMIQNLINQAFIMGQSKQLDPLEFYKGQQKYERETYEMINKMYEQNQLSEDKIDVIRYIYDSNLIILSDEVYKFLRLFIKFSFQPDEGENQIMSLQDAIKKGIDTVQAEMLNNLYAVMKDKPLNIPQFVYDLENQLFGGKYLNSTNVLIQLCKFQQMIILSNYYQYEWSQCSDIIVTHLQQSKLVESLANTQVNEHEIQYSWIQLLDQIIQCVDIEKLNDFLTPSKQTGQVINAQDNIQQEILELLNNTNLNNKIVTPYLKQTLSKLKIYFTNFRRGYAQLIQEIAFSGLIAVSNKQQHMLQERAQTNTELAEEQQVEYQIFLIQEQLYNISLDQLYQMYNETLNMYIQFPLLGKKNYKQHLFTFDKIENARKQQDVQEQLGAQNLIDVVSQLDNIQGIQRHNLILTANILTECYQKMPFNILSGIKQYSYNAIGTAIEKNFYTQHVFFTFMNTIQRQLRFVLSYGLAAVEKILLSQCEQLNKKQPDEILQLTRYEVKQTIFEKVRIQILQIISIAQNANKYVCGLVMKTMIPVSNNLKLSFLTLLIVYYNTFNIPEEENQSLLDLIVNSFESNPQESFILLQNDMKHYITIPKLQQCQLLDLLVQKILSQSNTFVHKSKLDQIVTFKFNSSFKDTKQIPLQTSTGCNITLNGQLDSALLQSQSKFFTLGCKLFSKLTTTKILKQDIQIQQFVAKNVNLLVLQILKMKVQQLDLHHIQPQDALLSNLMQILAQFDPIIQVLSKLTSLALLQFNINTKHRQLVSCYKACHSGNMQIECAVNGCVQCTVQLNQTDIKQEQFIQEPISGIIDSKAMIYYCQMIDQIVKEERLNSLNIQEVIALLCLCLSEEFVQQQLEKHHQSLVEQVISLIVTTIFNIGSKCTNVSLFLATIIDYEFIYNILQVCLKYIYKNTTKVVLFSVLSYVTGQQSPLGKILVNQAIQCGVLSPGYINYLLAKETLISQPGYIEYMMQILNNVYFQSCNTIRAKYKNILTQDFFDITLQITSLEARYSLFQLVTTLLQFSNDFLGKVAGVMECGWMILKSKGSTMQQIASIIIQMIRNSILSTDLYIPTVISQLPLLTALLDSKEYDINIKSKIVQVFDILLTHVGTLSRLREQKVNDIIVAKVIQLNQISEKELVEPEQIQIQQFKTVLKSVSDKKLFTPEQDKIIQKYVK